MITGELKSRIDKLWLEFHTGGITNPLTVIEQITYLMFLRLLDIEEARRENRAKRTGNNKGLIYDGRDDPRRWSRLKELGDPDQLLERMHNEVFPMLKTMGDSQSTFANYMKSAQPMIEKSSLLKSAMGMIDELPLERADTKGDLYEYLLGKLNTAGINGQFRTPRHIIRMMVDVMQPNITDRIADPACGTAGFLVAVIDYLKEHYSSSEAEGGTLVHDDGSKSFLGDKLTPAQWKFICNGMFHGFDFDSTMLRIGAMNLMTHGVDNPAIEYMDTLSNRFTERKPEYAQDAFDLILANPPFKGSLDAEQVAPSLARVVKTKKTELLFLALILRMLRTGGRAAVIVPDGVLFGASKAHTALRKELIENHQLEGVISLPSGVFKPYAGVSTAILLFTKAGETQDVWFTKVENDGYSLDDKRTKIDANDLPDLVKAWHSRNPKRDTDRKAKSFFVSKEELADAKYDLSYARYEDVIYEEVEYDKPKTIIKRLKKMESKIAGDLMELGRMLK